MSWKLRCFVVTVVALLAVAWGWSGWSRYFEMERLYDLDMVHFERYYDAKDEWWEMNRDDLSTECLLQFLREMSYVEEALDDSE